MFCQIHGQFSVLLKKDTQSATPVTMWQINPGKQSLLLNTLVYL